MDGAEAWREEDVDRLSLYVHIPFCQDLCTFCGCNTRITRSHSFVAPYVEALLSELDLYLRALGRERIVLLNGLATPAGSSDRLRPAMFAPTDAQAPDHHCQHPARPCGTAGCPMV